MASHTSEAVMVLLAPRMTMVKVGTASTVNWLSSMLVTRLRAMEAPLS